MELKNGIRVRGVLSSVDQFINLKLDKIVCVNQLEHPQFVSAYSCFSFCIARSIIVSMFSMRSLACLFEGRSSDIFILVKMM